MYSSEYIADLLYARISSNYFLVNEAMVYQKQDNITVMFADVVGSTSLYKLLGDRKAQKIISQALDIASKIVNKYSGEVLKTAGDDILCSFHEANNAITAACVIHDTFSETSVFNETPLAFHVGIHSGSGIFVEGDVFGDVTNVASRLTSIAKPDQIITSKETVDQLTHGLNSKVRALDSVAVRGRGEPVDIYDVIWRNTGEETYFVDVTCSLTGGKLLVLEYKDQIINILPDSHPFVLGRDISSGLVIASTKVSREHASIEYRRNKFVFRDISTNGTYLRFKNEGEFFLKREDTALVGNGVISLGTAIDDQSDLNVKFQCV